MVKMKQRNKNIKEIQKKYMFLMMREIKDGEDEIGKYKYKTNTCFW